MQTGNQCSNRLQEAEEQHLFKPDEKGGGGWGGEKEREIKRGEKFPPNDKLHLQIYTLDKLKKQNKTIKPILLQVDKDKVILKV